MKRKIRCKKIMRVFMVVFLLSLGMALSQLLASDAYGAGAQHMSLQSSPKEVIEEFCQLDAKGTRLSSNTRGDIDQLLDWGQEGGYDEIVIIKAFKVNKAAIRKLAATVSVEYYMLGSTDSFVLSGVPNEKSIVNFKLIKKDGRWKIKEPVIAPHVSWRKVIDHLRLLQRDEPLRKKQLEGIIKKIGQAAE